MNPNVKFSERTAVLAKLDPVSQAAATVVTTWVPMAKYHSICALLQTGALGTAATVDAKLRQAQDSSGTGAKDITGKAITQLVKASNDNNMVTIEARSDELDQANGFTHVALSVTVGAAASLISALVMGVNPRYMPASADNIAAVVQQI